MAEEVKPEEVKPEEAKPGEVKLEEAKEGLGCAGNGLIIALILVVVFFGLLVGVCGIKF